MTTSSDYYKLKAFFDEMDRGEVIEIHSDRYWFKIVEFLQTNWALIEELADGRAIAWFVNDNSGVFDAMMFESLEAAVEGLMTNSFDFLSANPEGGKFLVPPPTPFKRDPHPNGRIYSDGKFWIKSDKHS